MIDISKILQYYAIICLALSPVSIFLFVLVYRKTNLIGRIDRVIDRILGIREEEAPYAEETTASAEEKQASAEQPAAKKEEDLPEPEKVTRLTLRVGDMYFCRRNPGVFSGGYYEYVWTTDNEFAGRIGEEGILECRKAGRINVLCSLKGNSFEKPVLAYTVDIIPSENACAAISLIEAVERKARQTDIIAANIKNRIEREYPKAETMTFSGEGPVQKTTYQFDRNGNLLRGVMVLKRQEKGELEACLKERFEQVRMKNENTQLWIHRLRNAEKDEIDYYVYVISDPGRLIFGAGRNWRQGGEVEEFLLNAEMAGRALGDCLPACVLEKPVLDDNPVEMDEAQLEEFNERKKELKDRAGGKKKTAKKKAAPSKPKAEPTQKENNKDEKPTVPTKPEAPASVSDKPPVEQDDIPDMTQDEGFDEGGYNEGDYSETDTETPEEPPVMNEPEIPEERAEVDFKDDYDDFPDYNE